MLTLGIALGLITCAIVGAMLAWLLIVFIAGLCDPGVDAVEDVYRRTR